MITKKIFQCEDSIEGIFSAIYDAWNSKFGHNNIKILVLNDKDNGDLELFSEYINVKAEEEKANKVAKAVKDKISVDAYHIISTVICSEDKDKGDAIYRFLILGFSLGAKVIDYLSNDIVIKIHNMNRNVNNEVHHFLGFVRFKEIENQILFSKINPKNNVLRLIAPHFSDRMNQENFIVYDEKRKTAIIHRAGAQWIYTYADHLNLEIFEDTSKQEEEYNELWKAFFNAIAIEERKNYKLQTNNLPKRFRSNMLEFDSKGKIS